MSPTPRASRSTSSSCGRRRGRSKRSCCGRSGPGSVCSTSGHTAGLSGGGGGLGLLPAPDARRPPSRGRRRAAPQTYMVPVPCCWTAGSSDPTMLISDAWTSWHLQGFGVPLPCHRGGRVMTKWWSITPPPPSKTGYAPVVCQTVNRSEYFHPNGKHTGDVCIKDLKERHILPWTKGVQMIGSPSLSSTH